MLFGEKLLYFQINLALKGMEWDFYTLIINSFEYGTLCSSINSQEQYTGLMEALKFAMEMIVHLLPEILFLS